MHAIGGTMNEFQENKADTTERTLAERHIEGVRQQGGGLFEAVRVTRMPMLVTDATFPGNPITFANQAFIELSGYTMDELLGQDPHFMNGDKTDPEATDCGEKIRDADEVINIARKRIHPAVVTNGYLGWQPHAETCSPQALIENNGPAEPRAAASRGHAVSIREPSNSINRRARG